MKKAFIILLCVLAVFAIVSCKNEPKPEPEPQPGPEPGPVVETFDVSFDSQGGTAVSKATVEKNDRVERPAKPTKESKAFGGWYTEAACENRYDFSTPVTADFTLYGRWIDDYEGITEMTATKGVNEGLYSYDKFRIQFGDGSAATFAKDDVLRIVYRSSRPIHDYSVRNDSIKWIYEQPRKAALPDGFLTEADEDGWITITYTFAAKTWDGGADVDYATATKKFYVDFIGTIIKDDVLEIKSATKNGDPIEFTVLTGKYVKPEEKSIKASDSTWTGDVTYVVQFLDTLDLDSDNNPKGTAASVGKGLPVDEPEAPVREGQVFGGWNTKKDGSGSAWDFDTPIEADTKLYTVWTAQ